MKKYKLAALLLLVLLPFWGPSLAGDCTSGSCTGSTHAAPCLEGVPASKELPRPSADFSLFNISFQKIPLDTVTDIFVPPS